MWFFKDGKDKTQEAPRVREEISEKTKKSPKKGRIGTKKSKTGAIEMIDINKCQICRQIYLPNKGAQNSKHCAECANNILKGLTGARIKTNRNTTLVPSRQSSSSTGVYLPMRKVDISKCYECKQLYHPGDGAEKPRQCRKCANKEQAWTKVLAAQAKYKNHPHVRFLDSIPRKWDKKRDNKETRKATEQPCNRCGRQITKEIGTQSASTGPGGPCWICADPETKETHHNACHKKTGSTICKDCKQEYTPSRETENSQQCGRCANKIKTNDDSHRGRTMDKALKGDPKRKSPAEQTQLRKISTVKWDTDSCENRLGQHVVEYGDNNEVGQSSKRLKTDQMLKTNTATSEKEKEQEAYTKIVNTEEQKIDNAGADQNGVDHTDTSQPRIAEEISSHIDTDHAGTSQTSTATTIPSDAGTCQNKDANHTDAGQSSDAMHAGADQPGESNQTRLGQPCNLCGKDIAGELGTNSASTGPEGPCWICADQVTKETHHNSCHQTIVTSYKSLPEHSQSLPEFLESLDAADENSPKKAGRSRSPTHADAQSNKKRKANQEGEHQSVR